MKKKLCIVADDHIWGAESAFTHLAGFDVDLRLLENKHINHAALSDADILLTRSATQVNEALLAGTAVRFSATATIGDDHYDKPWLDAHGIRWANAAGSSTASVLEYMLTVLFDLHARNMINISQTCIGVIGVGRIGTALATLCEAMGMTVLLNDPPRQREEGGTAFCSLNTILAEADIISLHTPLIRSAADCTVHLLSQTEMNAFEGKGIINAGRGQCVDNAALCGWLDADDGHFAVLDCWEHEPAPLSNLINHSGMAIATPHIAGHSVEGKAANTQYIYNALCRFLAIEPQWDMTDELPVFPAPVEIPYQADTWQSLHAASQALYPISNDDTVMRSWAELSSGDLAQSFAQYRRNYPARRDWQHAAIRLADADAVNLAQAIGFKVV